MKNIYRIMGAAALAAACAGAASAREPERLFLLDESSARIERLADPVPAAAAAPATPGVEAVVKDIASIINLGEKILAIIEKNKPVIDVSVKYAAAVPDGVKHWTQLQGWSRPQTRRYAFSMKNLLGAKVVDVVYQVHWVYGGNYQGKGKFLTGVTIEPVSVWTVSGYKVSLSAEIPDSAVVNVGTHEDPVAALQARLKWTVHTSIKEIQQSALYYVEGTGEMTEIGSPFAKASADRTEAILSRFGAQGFD